MLSVGVKTASTPSAISASAASITSSVVVPVRSTYSIPFSSRYAFAFVIGVVDASCPWSYKNPIFFASGF